MDYSTFINDGVMIAAGFHNSTVYPRSLVETLIMEVECFLPASRWSRECTACDRRELAIKYLVAHRLTTLVSTGAIGQSVTGTGGLVSGQISSISASKGSQSVSFTQSSSETSGAGWLIEGQTPTVWWNFFQSLMTTRVVAVGFTV